MIIATTSGHGVTRRNHAQVAHHHCRVRAAFASTEVETRLIAWLLEQPVVDDNGRRMVVLPMAKKDIASFLGTTPETLSRRLAGLARDGLIGLAGQRRIVLMDTSELEARAAGRTR
jgi:CRP/FNR family transcriptional regulator